MASPTPTRDEAMALLREFNESEMLIRHAVGGETAATLSFGTPSNVALWKNVAGPYGNRAINYSAMTPGSGASEYTVSGTSITFGASAVSAGDAVTADYDHTLAAPPRSLHAIAARLTAAECLYWVFQARGGATNPLADRMNEQAAALLAKLNERDGGVPEFDAVTLYRETERGAASGYGAVRVSRWDS